MKVKDYSSIKSEHALKNEVFDDFFKPSYFKWSQEEDKIDFILKERKSEKALLWAECKLKKTPPFDMITQLILTIKKPYQKGELPPPFLAVFDREEITFFKFYDIQEVFALNDFNWNITPSNHKSEDFGKARDNIKIILKNNFTYFNFKTDLIEINNFIQNNLMKEYTGTLAKTLIDKNNFIIIYHKWEKEVKPTIAVNWEVAKQKGLMDSDFYLADLLSSNNTTISENLNVLLKENKYHLYREIDDTGLFSSKEASFKDGQKAHQNFWQRYERPPKEEYHEYILTRRDLLLPSDVRERKGSFFTPAIWVEKSQEALANVLGINWQDEYYIWDPAAGTGNLLEGLVNPRHIFASTLDKADIDIIHERISKKTSNLFQNHVFQFDFLNDPFENLPEDLKKIIRDSEKRKKLIIYMNPPYAEATTAKTVSGTGKNKAGVTDCSIKKTYSTQLGKARNEVFSLFLMRIYQEMNGCFIGEFSTLKALQGENFKVFRDNFQAKLETTFIVPAETFDNVKGKFPIGFKIWNTAIHERFTKIEATVFDKKGDFIGQKTFKNLEKDSINKWIKGFESYDNPIIGYLPSPAPDFQNNNFLFISTNKGTRHVFYSPFTKENLIPLSIYFAVRKSPPATWLNDRDQFLSPRDGWQEDFEFQNDCLVYTLFHSSNTIKSQEGTNHWIPFTEKEIGVNSAFESDFMVKFIQGKFKDLAKGKVGDMNLLEREFNFIPQSPLVFSSEAQEVFNVAKNLWQYYHQEAKGKENYSINASLYDIKLFFQGKSLKTGNMNSNSSDKEYNQKSSLLSASLKILGKKIEMKTYAYQFLYS